MKLTWFGQSALRIHIGGQVVVIDADKAAAAVDRNELCSGADHVLTLSEPGPVVDGKTWKPRAALRLLEAGETVRPVGIWSLGVGALLIDPDEDMPLLVLGAAIPEVGRWVERAVVVLAGEDIAGRAIELMDRAAPKLVALAGSEAAIEDAFAAVRDRLDGTGLLALEPGLAMEA